MEFEDDDNLWMIFRELDEIFHIIYFIYLAKYMLDIIGGFFRKIKLKRVGINKIVKKFEKPIA